MTTIIRIANPTPGGHTYTSGKRALKFIRRGQATLTSDGELFFFVASAVQAQRELERIDAEIARNHRKGVVFWNGADKDAKAMHRPGEVRC